MTNALISRKALQILVDEALDGISCNEDLLGEDELLPWKEAVKAAQDALAAITFQNDLPPAEDFGVAEFYEYDCGSPCTENGCLGHETNVPMSIEFKGVLFHVDGAEGGDFPSSDSEHVQRVIDAVDVMYQRLNSQAVAQMEAENERRIEFLSKTAERLKKIVLYHDTEEVKEVFRIWLRGDADEHDGEGIMIDWLEPPPGVDEILERLP